MTSFCIKRCHSYVLQEFALYIFNKKAKQCEWNHKLCVEYGGFEMNKQELAKEVVKLWLKEGKKINTEDILKVCLSKEYIEKIQ